MGRPSQTALMGSYTSLEFANMTEDAFRANKTNRLTNYMASAWRVISFFLVVFVLPTVLISLPLYARYHLYHARHLPMTETDTRALNYAVSSFWCQGQRVTSNGTLDAYKVAGSPRVQTQRRQVTLRRNLTLRHDDIEYWGVYLLEGSTFSLSSVARWPGGTLLVVRSEDNLRKCFYRENSVTNQLNGETAHNAMTNVYRSPYDVEPNDNEKQKQLEEEEGGTGGEVFDEVAELKVRSHELVDENYDLIMPLLSGEKLQKVANVAEKKVKSKAKGLRRKNKGKKKNLEGEEHKERHGRNRRSRLLERIRRDTQQESSPAPNVDQLYDSDVADKLHFLHKFNDTLDVTTGNSSFSSSEEFLEQCKDTILTVNLSPYIEWKMRVLNLNSDNPDAWNFTVNATDYYYFIFTSDNNIEQNDIGFHLQLERAVYDVSSPLETCQNSSECVFPLAFTQTESVVVDIPAGGDLSELHSFEVTTTCQPRVPVYMVFILLVPFIILLFAFQ